MRMPRATVTLWNRERGYGFAILADGTEVFLGGRELARTGAAGGIKAGMRIFFQVRNAGNAAKNPRATNVKVWRLAMAEKSSPTSTAPLGNSDPPPGALEVGGIGANVRRELGKLNPELKKRLLDEAARSARPARS
jgi:cold shock CspA family protein